MSELSRRRTFAIISHPDAGKTTLTEKLLLYGGALQLAGSVTARKNRASTTSDWMELEKKRGISVSSTVLQFDYDGYRVNLLDTPGHRDFSEDTYRVLTAVDSVIMVLDGANGIESRTRKLFEVCRNKEVPIFTFVNKMDRPSKEPLSLLDELETDLALHPFAMNWPLGNGQDFKGVYDRVGKKAYLFERTPGGAYRAAEDVRDLDDPLLAESMSPDTYKQFREETHMLDEMGNTWDHDAVLSGNLTPVFFGSAVNNFGVQNLLDGFLKHSPAPLPRKSSGRVVLPEEKPFSGFIFKIQGNMDPRHRDRIAFIRVCSGKFTRDMAVIHHQTGKRFKLANSHKLFGQEREIVEDAYPGDVIGLVGYPEFRIGDTLSEDQAIVFDETPRFAPECFSFLNNPSPVKYKAFRKGLEQLLAEEVAMTFNIPGRPDVLLGAVGPLQFDVIQYRLEAEYGAPAKLEPALWTMCRWVQSPLPEEPRILTDSRLGADAKGRPVIFFGSDYSLRFFQERHPDVKLQAQPPK